MSSVTRVSADFDLVRRPGRLSTAVKLVGVALVVRSFRKLAGLPRGRRVDRRSEPSLPPLTGSPLSPMLRLGRKRRNGEAASRDGALIEPRPTAAAGGDTEVGVGGTVERQARLVLLCGLPASGKSTLARELVDQYRAVRLNPDEWEVALGVDPFDQSFQARLEGQFWSLTQRLLTLGTSVVLEWGFWTRRERDELRDAARSLGAAVELRFLDAPFEELVQRVVDRHAGGGLAITEHHMEQYHGAFEPPTAEELALYDPPLERGRS